MHASETTLTWGDNHVLGYTPMDDIHEEFVDLIGQMQVAIYSQLS